MLYWNPQYNSITKEPIDENSREIAEDKAFALYEEANEKGTCVINGEDNMPTIK